MQNDKLDPVIDRYRRELMEFSKKNPKFNEEDVQTTVENNTPVLSVIKPEEAILLNSDADSDDDNMSVLRSNVAQNESQNEGSPTVEEGLAIRDELMFSENAELFPPYNNGSPKLYRNIEEFLVDNPRTGFLRVQVFAGEQTFPISNANIVITKNFDGKENIFYEEHTDSSGVMSRISLPAPDRSLSIYPSSLQPYSTYDIVATHPGFNRVIIKNCVVFDGIETSQLIEMIPGTRPSGEDVNNTKTETFDTLNGGN